MRTTTEVSPAWDDTRYILSLLSEPRRRTLPALILPANVQWRLLDLASDTREASTILDRPEFSPLVKFHARERASLEARTAWMSSDPAISDGEYLLEALRLAQHPRAGSASVHLLGNRPSLAMAIVELGLVPLFPAAARHTRNLDEHIALMDAMAGCGNQLTVCRAVELFCARTDVSWLLRSRVRRLFPAGLRRSHPDVPTITESWDAVGFGEAGSPDGLRHLPPNVARTRRAAALVLAREHDLPPPVVSAARETARRSVAETITQQLAEGCSHVAAVPPELAAIIDTRPLLAALDGEVSPAAGRSMAPASIGRLREPNDRYGRTQIYRATPNGSVEAVGPEVQTVDA